MKKLNIAVLFGGCSSEYGVSLTSASAVIGNMDAVRFNPVMVGITREGKWFYYTGPLEKIKDDTWHNETDCTPAAILPDRGENALTLFGINGQEKLPLDAAFPVLHGKNGEDGTVQGLIELAGIPLVGCGVLASALCMDKDRAHKLAQLAGVDVPRAFSFNAHTPSAEYLKFAESLGYPLFVKPVKAGSSYGISKVMGAEEVYQAIKLAFEHDDEVIIEQAIEGFEVGCAIMGNDNLIIGEVDEIELSDGFFDFTEKYNLITSAIHVPARIDPLKAEEIKHTAKVIYKALGCTGFARVDMFLQPDGGIVFNEVNTIPGFTEHSRFPGMMKAAGVSFSQIISYIINLAVQGETHA